MNTAELRSILEEGILAPSADNMQPWKFQIRGDQVDLYLDREEWAPFVDRANQSLYTSAGAVIENMRVAAAQLGHCIHPSYFPDPSHQTLVATLRFESIREKGHRHYSVLDQRVTNRKFYDGRRKIHHSTYQKLGELAAQAEFHLLWVKKEEPAYSKLARLIGKSDQLRFENQRIHEAFIETVRFDDAETQRLRDGLNPKTFEVGPAGTLLFQWIKTWARLRILNYLGMSRGFNFYARLQVQTSQALGLMVQDNQRPIDYVRGGEIMERVWHEITCQGLAIQPMMALPIFITDQVHNQGLSFHPPQRMKLEAMKREFYSIFQIREENGLTFLFRIGYAKPPSARSLRRPLDSFLVS